MLKETKELSAVGHRTWSEDDRKDYKETLMSFLNVGLKAYISVKLSVDSALRPRTEQTRATRHQQMLRLNARAKNTIYCINACAKKPK